MHRILGVMLICPTLCMAAERFFLVENTSGETTAPIVFTNGAQVAIGPNNYTLKMSDDIVTQTEARMRNIIIPAVEFREAAIPDVINYLIAAAQGEMDAPRLNMVLNDYEPSSRPPNAGTITLQLSRVSLYDTLRIVCEKSDMEFHIDDSGIIQVTPRDPKIQRGQQGGPGYPPQGVGSPDP